MRIEIEHLKKIVFTREEMCKLNGKDIWESGGHGSLGHGDPDWTTIRIDGEEYSFQIPREIRSKSNQRYEEYQIYEHQILSIAGMSLEKFMEKVKPILESYDKCTTCHRFFLISEMIKDGDDFTCQECDKKYEKGE